MPLKNVEHIIKSFVKVKNNFPGASLRIVGDGPQREELEDEVVRSNASDIFFLGRLSREETIKQYKNADIFVSASKFETGGTTFIEAMAAGLPIVTTPVGASVEIMKEKINCFFVEIGDSDEVSKKIEIHVFSNFDSKRDRTRVPPTLLNLPDRTVSALQHTNCLTKLFSLFG